MYRTEPGNIFAWITLITHACTKDTTLYYYIMLYFLNAGVQRYINISTMTFPCVMNVMTQLLCSIEKAVWKLAQSGPSTEANMYHYRLVYTSTFFSNGRISETKQDFVNALVAKRHPRTGLSSTLSWKWPRPTLSSSFGLFFEREHFFGVFQVGQSGPLRPKTCPWDPMASPKRFRKFAVKIERLP